MQVILLNTLQDLLVSFRAISLEHIFLDSFEQGFWHRSNIPTFFSFFLEESFAALIAIIFIYEAFDKMIEISGQKPVRLQTVNLLSSKCTCVNENGTIAGSTSLTINVILRQKI